MLGAFDMSKIFSKYLNKEIEVNFWETADTSGTVTIITHDSLEDAILNQASDYGVKYDKSLEYVSDTHCVVKCTIADNKGRRIQCFGEAVPATLNTEIALNNPVIMAEKRAFDRAAIRYLNLPGRVYSNDESIQTVSEDSLPQNDTVIPYGSGKEDDFLSSINPEELMPDTDEMNGISEDALSLKNETVIATSSIGSSDAFTLLPDEDFEPILPSESVQQQVQKPVPEYSILPNQENTISEPPVTAKSSMSANEHNSFGKVEITLGKFATNPTTVEAVCNDPNQATWLNVILSSKSYSTGPKAEQVRAIKNYMAQEAAV